MLKHHTHFHTGPPSPKQKQTTFPELTYPTMGKKNIFKSALGWYMLVPSKVTFPPFFLCGPTNFRGDPLTHGPHCDHQVTTAKATSNGHHCDQKLGCSAKAFSGCFWRSWVGSIRTQAQLIGSSGFPKGGS